MGNLDYSRLSKDLTPYLAPMIRKALDAALAQASLPKASGGSGGLPPAPAPPYILEPHVLATTAGLGGKHTVTGLTAGQVLRASGPTAAAFAQLQHGDLGSVTADQHHAQVHSLDGGDHTGTLSWSKVNKTGSDLAHLATRRYIDLTDRAHNIVGADHTITGAQYVVVGATTANTLGLLTPSADVSGGDTAILRSNAGALTVNALTAAGATPRVRTPLIDTASGDLSLSPAGNVKLTSAKRIGTDYYVSQTTGWAIDYAGGADFRYLFTDELHAKSFIADLEQALAGGQIISKSVAVLAVDFVAPAAGGTTTLRVKDLPSAPDMAVFVSGDIVRLRSFSRSGGSLSITDCWGAVTGYTDQSDGTQTWTFTRSSAPNAGAMTTGATVAADALVLDYGTSGNGYYEVNAIDGAYALNSPYAQAVTWTGHPATGLAVRTRMGNLRGIFGIADEYGLYAGTGTTDSDAYLRASSTSFALNNVPLSMYSSGVRVGRWASNGQLDIGFAGIDTANDRDFSVHATGYVRIGRVGADKPNLLYTAGGDLHLRSNTTPVITLAGDGSSYFAGPMGLGASGGIYQGTGTFASPTTGIKIWNDSGIGRIAGYKSGVLQVGFTSSGVLTAGAGAVILDADGATIVSGSKVESTLEPLPPAGYAWGYGSTWATTNALTLAVPGYAGDYFDASMWAYTNTYPDNASIQSQRDVRLRMVAPSRAYGLLARMVVGVNNSGMDIVERTDGWTSTLPDIHGVHIKVSNAQRLVATATGIDMYGAVTASSTISATGAISTGSTLTVTGIITANSGATILDRSSATYRGLSMLAVPGSAWAFGLTYRNSSDTMLGAWGAYGGADTLSYLYSGVNYNDTTLRVYPATDRVGIGADVVPAFTLDVAGDVNATGTFRRNGTEGNILIFIPPFNLTDTGSTTWSGVTRAAGSYHFDVQLNGNGLPDAARGVLVWLSGTWSGANNSYYCALYQYGSGTHVGDIRAYASAISIDAQISVPLDASGRFTATVAGAVSMTNSYMRIIGYYI